MKNSRYWLFCLFIFPVFTFAQSSKIISVAFADFPLLYIEDTTFIANRIRELKEPKAIEQFLNHERKNKYPNLTISIVITINKVPYTYEPGTDGLYQLEKIPTGEQGFEGELIINDLTDFKNFSNERYLIVDSLKVPMDLNNGGLKKLEFFVLNNKVSKIQVKKNSEYDLLLKNKFKSKLDENYSILVKIPKDTLFHPITLQITVAGDSTKKAIMDYMHLMSIKLPELSKKDIMNLTVIRFQDKGIISPKSLEQLLKEK